MRRYVAKAGRMPVTVPDGVELPAASYEPVADRPRQGGRKAPSKGKAAGKGK